MSGEKIQTRESGNMSFEFVEDSPLITVIRSTVKTVRQVLRSPFLHIASYFVCRGEGKSTLESRNTFSTLRCAKKREEVIF